jgi:hypothetical protein
MIGALVLLVQLAAAPVAVNCPLPKLRDTRPLHTAAQEDGALSIALDGVANGCFAAEGEWNGGKGGAGSKGGLGPECRKALLDCELARSARKRSAAAHLLDDSVAGELKRPFTGKLYPAQSSEQVPGETADEQVSCKAPHRAVMAAQAQRRSELSKGHSRLMSEYASYRAWLELQRRKCREGSAAPATPVAASLALPDGGTGAPAETSPRGPADRPESVGTATLVEASPGFPARPVALANGLGPDAGLKSAQGSPKGAYTTVNGMSYYHPPATTTGPVVTAPAPGFRAPTGPGSQEPNVPLASPAREEGRFYVRLSMSSTCVAELSPGPIQARNGDLILVPFAAPSLEVKSACGGVAEIYYGKEPTPRFSEIFGRGQPVSFLFKP